MYQPSTPPMSPQVAAAWFIVAIGGLLLGLLVNARFAATAHLEAPKPITKADPALARPLERATASPVAMSTAPDPIAAPPRMPRFANYPTRVNTARVPLRLTGASGWWDYRSRLRWAHAAPVNFGSSSVITMWGCGAGCRVWVMVDRATGQIHSMPRSGEDFPYVDYWSEPGSNLLLGFWENDAWGKNPSCIFEAFIWIGGRFREVRSYPVRIAGSCPDVTVFRGT